MRLGAIICRRETMILDTDLILLVSMLKKARLAAEWGKQTKHLCPSNTRVETFLSEFKLEVEQTCRVLEFLGLVDKCSSELGYKPTHRLIDIHAGTGQARLKPYQCLLSQVEHTKRTWAAATQNPLWSNAANGACRHQCLRDRSSGSNTVDPGLPCPQPL
jgi:hypothetical protein